MNGKTVICRDDVLVMALFLTDSNEDILDKMRAMRQARSDTSFKNVVCTVSGFGHDPRELWAIPEVRAFCRRLMTLGFASFLDASTTLAHAPAHVRGAWGAYEVWMTAEGRLGPGLTTRMNTDRAFARTVLVEWKAMLDRQNVADEVALGPTPR